MNRIKTIIGAAGVMMLAAMTASAAEPRQAADTPAAARAKGSLK